jgi:hypothetical protein
VPVADSKDRQKFPPLILPVPTRSSNETALRHFRPRRPLANEPSEEEFGAHRATKNDEISGYLGSNRKFQMFFMILKLVCLQFIGVSKTQLIIYRQT